MVKNFNEELKKEEKTFNLLLIAVLTPLLAGLVIIITYLF